MEKSLLINPKISLRGKAGSVGVELKHSKWLAAALTFLVIMIFASFIGTLLLPQNPNTQGDLVNERYLAPSPEHPFGTDKFARDVFCRVLYGGRVSLSIAFGVVLLSLLIGVFYGTISGYIGGCVDMVAMRILDFVSAYPVIFLIITIIALFRPGVWALVLILGLTSWMDTARLVRAEVLSLKERDFILAAKSLGLSPLRILFHHLIPNALSPVFVMIPLKIGEIILLESALSFLGIGVQPPTASWGNIINDGRAVLMDAPWVSIFPGIFIILTVISFNLIGEAVRELLKRSPGV